MKKQSIQAHLSTYSILRKRKTTINHAFASAIAPVEKYDELRLDAAIRLLGQDPDDLKCVYCKSEATTWDHLVGLVENSELRGYGHQIGNLVPCCRDCNSKKGAKDWETHLKSTAHEADFEQKREVIARYIRENAEPVDLKILEEEWPDQWAEYCAIKQEIFVLMAKADRIAEHLRDVVTAKKLRN